MALGGASVATAMHATKVEIYVAGHPKRQRINVLLDWVSDLQTRPQHPHQHQHEISDLAKRAETREQFIIFRPAWSTFRPLRE
jgi:hypothetical protein